MRIKTIQRNASNVIRVMKKGEQLKLSIINTNINSLLKLIKDVERELEEKKNGVVTDIMLFYNKEGEESVKNPLEN